MSHAARAETSETLVALRARSRDAKTLRAMRAMLRRLERDPRSGARVLEHQIGRRVERHLREKRRQRRLFRLRNELLRGGARFVAGVDEVGVGPLAGPVVAAAVILPRRIELPGLDDSKQVPRPARERLARAIREQALAFCVAHAEVAEIDEINIYWAALLAMRRAVEGLAIPPDRVLVDARTIPGIEVAQRALVGGDRRDGTIAAASILAKVQRDALMTGLDARHPGYGFARHMGYPTAAHRAALGRLGPSPIHRRSFALGPAAPPPS